MTPSWQDLDIAESLAEAMLELGHLKPTRIQQQVIPEAMAARDILASSPTGTGKTLAYVIPAMQHLIDFPRQTPGSARILVLAPTRELAAQIHEQVAFLCRYTGHTSLLVTGGVNFGSHLSAFDSNLDILVSTPGRLLDYLGQERFSAEDIEWLVLDEADRMLDMGFADAVANILAEARHVSQRLLFSATLEGAAIQRFSQATLNEPVYVDAQPPKRERGKIVQWVHVADTLEHKQQLLQHLVNEHPLAVLVFVKTKERVLALTQLLRGQNYRVSMLHGDMPQHARTQALEDFTQGKNKILVATDVAARGIDIEDVQLVVNFDMPRRADVFLHRIGRTGRAGKKGLAVSLVEAHDSDMLGRVERYIGEKLERRFVKGLRPQHKFPEPGKSKAKKKKKKKAAKR
ncbi:ATP-dependent RNA helicase SrmB [Aliidiomarina maris]|uniref:ATP-dependent RNA helicase SrmB n=1 Tax=Aliidiomarina maris TaxID=531312 RepID=A0A327WSP8_9GAMM|nr:ATP-dependent RNA helicase SrmB [Aliidiomarina maris]MCL5051553.1 ATP-dependent RNA helicase SrmB [Bacillota bacterium]RAJ95390.1 ATP-dependent RNA helicase SrmB [Aliidiomarina maris]RUO22721.1 ATP-dependent RNA helicase SrmB [Aliidiomarina maris]